MLFASAKHARKIKNPRSLFGTAGDLRAISEQKHQAALVEYDYAYQDYFCQIHHRRGQ